jgi:putative DNA primase/helicase
VRLIPFNARFSDSNCDKDLPAKLKAEASGILAWAVRGCALWQRHGLGLPPAVSEATRAYQQESDPLAEFLERYECCPDGVVESAHLRQDYQQWASETGDKPLDSRALAARLRARGFVDIRIGNKRVRAWRAQAEGRSSC